MNKGNHIPTIWALHDGKIGMANQVMGLAEATGYRVQEKPLRIRLPWRPLPPALWIDPLAALSSAGAQLAPPWPEVIVACGRLTVAPALAVKRLSGGRSFWVHIQDPRFAHRHVDLMVVPAHDPARGANAIVTHGAVHRVTTGVLEIARRRFSRSFADLPRPLIGVLIGGNNRAYRITRAIISRLGDQLTELAHHGFGIAITPSRRTSEAVIPILQQKLAGVPHFLWDGQSENPYFGVLALADSFAVTCDSVNMISEAASTGKPVHVIGLEGGSAKFVRFHDHFRELGITRPFTGEINQWPYPPPNDTVRAAEEIQHRLARHLREAA